MVHPCTHRTPLATLVTGGRRRIGFGIMERLARAGYAVVLRCSPSSQGKTEQEAARIVAEGAGPPH
jgi:NAD(P)-dependent dehydrogenase (short-subunit alcohol dehydrogenase family)